VHEYIEQGDRIVALVTTAWRNRKTGKTFEVPKADVWAFKSGKVVDFLRVLRHDEAHTRGELSRITARFAHRLHPAAGGRAKLRLRIAVHLPVGERS
jgi:hypothetical protein